MYYDDPKLAEAVQWYVDQSLNGISPPLADIKSLGAATLFTTGKGATTINGSWMIGQFLKDSSGPQGRKSMFNCLGDSIFVGTKYQEEAWQWVKFLFRAETLSFVSCVWLLCVNL